jgi:hypothetical protein
LRGVLTNLPVFVYVMKGLFVGQWVRKLTSTWRVRNLLGAMYLQFYSLITSTGALSRCKYCNRIISYAPPCQRAKGVSRAMTKRFVTAGVAKITITTIA